MDWNIVILTACWVMNNLFMYRIGYTRAFNDAEKLSGDMFKELPTPDEDAVYWRKMYEEEVNGREEAP